MSNEVSRSKVPSPRDSHLFWWMLIISVLLVLLLEPNLLLRLAYSPVPLTQFFLLPIGMWLAGSAYRVLDRHRDSPRHSLPAGSAGRGLSFSVTRLLIAMGMLGGVLAFTRKLGLERLDLTLLISVSVVLLTLLINRENAMRVAHAAGGCMAGYVVAVVFCLPSIDRIGRPTPESLMVVEPAAMIIGWACVVIGSRLWKREQVSRDEASASD